MRKSMWASNNHVSGPSSLPNRLIPADMRKRTLTGRDRSISPRLDGLGQGPIIRPPGYGYGTELINGPSSLPYRDLPIDMWPRPVDNYQRNPDGTIVEGGGLSPLEMYLDRIARDVGTLGAISTLRRGLFGRTVTVTTTPTRFITAEYLRGYILLNPNELAGATSSGTLLAAQSRGAATGDLTGTSATLGVANFLEAHYFTIANTFSGGAALTVVLQTLDPVTGTWIDVQDLVTGIVADTDTYSNVGQLGTATDARVRWSITAGDVVFSVGFVLKNGLIGTSAGTLQTIFLGGAGVSVDSGFPLLNGQKERFFLEENVQLFAVANASIPMRIFEL